MAFTTKADLLRTPMMGLLPEGPGGLSASRWAGSLVGWAVWQVAVHVIRIRAPRWAEQDLDLMFLRPGEPGIYDSEDREHDDGWYRRPLQ
jgi:hypothetical protein